MRQHTQGLLQINRNRGGAPTLHTESREVARVLFHSGSEDPEVQGNADRLLAAWNACDGIPTEHLQPGAVKALAEAAKEVLEIREGEDCTCADSGNYVCLLCRLVEPLEAALAPFREGVTHP